MQRQDEYLRTQIALGWFVNLLLLTIVLVLMVTESVITEADRNFRSLHYDPGREGVKLIVYLVAFYALVPVGIYLVNGARARAFKWVAVGLAVFQSLFNLAHHMQHWMLGQRPDFNSHVMDLTIHAVGLWVLVNTVKWARLPQAIPELDAEVVVRAQRSPI